MPNLSIHPDKLIYFVKDIVSFKCRKGFTLHGRERSACGFHGKFMDLPECKISHCVRPPTLPSHQMTLLSEQKELYNLGEVIEVECYNGLVLDGASRIICQNNGSFTTIPNCIINPIINSTFREIQGKLQNLRDEVNKNLTVSFNSSLILVVLCILFILIIIALTVWVVFNNQQELRD